MRHRRSGRQLNRNSGQRKALFRNLTKELFAHEVIHTTEAKAKAVRPQAEKLITLAKHGAAGTPRKSSNSCTAPGPGSSERSAGGEEAVRRSCATLCHPQGGYIRITKLGQRKGNSAEMVQIELLEE